MAFIRAVYCFLFVCWPLLLRANRTWNCQVVGSLISRLLAFWILVCDWVVGFWFLLFPDEYCLYSAVGIWCLLGRAVVWFTWLVQFKKELKEELKWETKGKATMAEWLNGGISSSEQSRPRRESGIGTKPNCGIAEAYFLATQSRSIWTNHKLMETKPAGSITRRVHASWSTRSSSSEVSRSL